MCGFSPVRSILLNTIIIFCGTGITEKYSGKVSHSINVKDFIKNGEKPVNRRNLNEKEKDIANKVADEISRKVEEIVKET